MIFFKGIVGLLNYTGKEKNNMNLSLSLFQVCLTFPCSSIALMLF